jgi:hypothetical protein
MRLLFSFNLYLIDNSILNLEPEPSAENDIKLALNQRHLRHTSQQVSPVIVIITQVDENRNHECRKSTLVST